MPSKRSLKLFSVIRDRGEYQGACAAPAAARPLRVIDRGSDVADRIRNNCEAFDA